MTVSCRFALIVLAVMTGPSAMAAETSPWFGSAGQAPFQLDPHAMVAMTDTADPLKSGSQSKAPCLLQRCTAAPDPVSQKTAAGGSP